MTTRDSACGSASRRGRTALSAAGAVLAVAETTAAPVTAQASGDTGATPTTLEGDFTSGAAEFHVPREVLMAVAYQESAWDTYTGQHTTDGVSTAHRSADRIQPHTDADGAREADFPLHCHGDGHSPVRHCQVCDGSDG